MSWPPPIELVPLGDSGPEPRVLRRIARQLKRLLRASVTVADSLTLDVETSESGQLSSNHLIDALLDHAGPDANPTDRWTILLTERDLAAPDRRFVFGEATFGGAWVVVSSARLRAEADGPDLVTDRLVKEIVHEIGHLAALEHCRRSSCVMHPSTAVVEIDRKNVEFCPNCTAAFSRPAGS